MLELRKIDEIATRAASTVLKAAGISRVFSRPTLDSDGHEALNVTVVLKNETYRGVTGDLALTTIVKIGQELTHSGEERLPIVGFATEEELAAEASLDANGDSES